MPLPPKKSDLPQDSPNSLRLGGLLFKSVQFRADLSVLPAGRRLQMWPGSGGAEVDWLGHLTALRTLDVDLLGNRMPFEFSQVPSTVK